MYWAPPTKPYLLGANEASEGATEGATDASEGAALEASEALSSRSEGVEVLGKESHEREEDLEETGAGRGRRGGPRGARATPVQGEIWGGEYG